MTKPLSTLLLVALAICAMVASGCNRQKMDANNDECVIDSAVVLSDTTVVKVDSIVEQSDSVAEEIVFVEADVSTAERAVDSAEDAPGVYFEDFFKMEVNKEDGYEVRRVNELAFRNSMAADTLLAALREMSPVEEKENISISVYPHNRIHLGKNRIHGPRMVIEGEERFEYHFGYIQIDTFFIDVKGFKSYGEDVKSSAERMFKKTGRTNAYKYKYYNPCTGGGKLYLFEITDSTVATLYKGISE